MTKLLEALTGASATDRESFRPEFFRLPVDKARLEELLKQETRIRVYDTLHGQLTELVRSLNPSIKFSKAELDLAAKAHLGNIPSEEYGVWVYYPWDQRLVHLLDEAEFVLVRTDRNRNKITRDEQAVLATKKVGVIGLSVGQSAAVTMALERSFGEIRLADFDTLELSNLNRIRSSTHEMGVPKVINTAREIAEIDPFLQVTCFHEGITNDNIDRFFTEGGNLDILIEECDSVAIKIIARQKAKALGIPVVMDTSDRGMVDIERFDLEPERKILHGLVDHLDLSLAAEARTNEEKMPFVVPVIGLETMSVRMKATMMELENTVTTWPQLASSVVLGGALGGHIMRRIVLGHPVPSGRWWMDPDDLIGVPEQEAERPELAYNPVPLTAEHSTLDLDGMIAASDLVSAAGSYIPMTAAEAAALSEAGGQAPSGGNCQPWRFLHHKGRMFVFMDVDRARSALDPGLRYAYLGLGACLENMLLEAGKLGLLVQHAFTPTARTPQLIAVLEARTRQAHPLLSAPDLDLAEQIPLRYTNRKKSEVPALSREELDSLQHELANDGTGAHLTLILHRETIDRIAELCGKAERIRFLNVTCHHDMFVREMRWDRKEVERTRDGIDVETLELSLTDRTGLRVAADPKAMSMLRFWGTGRAMEKIASKGVRASSALAIISVPDYEVASTFKGGRAMQRFWLRASQLGLLAHPVGAPIFMGIHQLYDTQRILSPEEHREAGVILEELKEIMGSGTRAPFFMLRLGKADEATARSLRRPLDEILHSTHANVTA